MLKSQSLLLEQSSKREKVNALLATDDLTEEQRTSLGALTSRLQHIEGEYRAALVAEPEKTETRVEDSGDRELRELVSGARSIGEVFRATLERRSTTDGKTAELQQHLGLASNQVPLALLIGSEKDQLEFRSTGATHAATNVGQTQSPIIPAVFPDSAATFLGVDMPLVPTGESVFHVMTGSATAHTPAEGAESAVTVGSIGSEALSPARIQAQFHYSREDRARMAGMDEALRLNLSEALASKLDKEIISGDDQGLLHGTVLAAHDVSTETTFALYKSQLAYSRVDGRYASGVGDIRIVMGSGTFAHAAVAYRASGNAADSTDAAVDMLMAKTGGVMVNAHVPAVASSKQEVIVRLGMRRDMVAPIWEGVTLINDDVTKAKSGEIVITAIMLHAIKVVRSAGFFKQQVQVVA